MSHGRGRPRCDAEREGEQKKSTSAADYRP